MTPTKHDTAAGYATARWGFGHAVAFALARWMAVAMVGLLCVVPVASFAHAGEGGARAVGERASRSELAGSRGAEAAAPIPVSTLKADPDAKDPSEVVPKVFENVTVVERLGTRLDGDLAFTDESGTSVRLSDIVDGSGPVIFTLNYFSCATLCSIQLQGFVNGLRGMADAKLRDIRVVTVSFDPNDGPEQARAKRDTVMAHFDGVRPRWSFLTGTEANVTALASSLGFQYRYDPETDQYAHTAAVFFVSPSGVVARYLYGIEYSARDIRFAWIDASEGKLGSTAERLLLNCFHYDEASGKYTPFAFKVVRIGGLVTVSFLGLMLGALWRKEKRRLAGGFERAA